MSVQTFDFVIGYENKVRELESACLLKYELERRGYSVFLFQEFDQRYDDVYAHLYHAKVLILSCGYSDQFVLDFCRRFLTFDKLVNWQWEQVFNEQLEYDPDSHLNVHGEIARQAVQLSWGQYNVNRLIDVMKLPKENVFKTGIISMDFLKPAFSKFYKSRNEVLAEYGINPEYKVAILIGVFQCAFMTDEELDALEKESGYDYRPLANENKKRFEIEMDWIRRALLDNPNLFFIYRPHPGDEIERCPKPVQDLLNGMSKETGRFIVNQDYTVRQWFKVADKVYTGFSTTMVDAYFAKVGCRLLSPSGIEMSEDVKLFYDIKETSTYEEFVGSLDETGFMSPLKEEYIDGYYSIGDELRYPGICDVLEKVLKDDRYLIDTSAIKEKIRLKSQEELASKSFLKRAKLKLWQYDWFYNLYWKCISIPINSGYIKKQKEYKNRIDQYYKRYVGSDEEISDITEKIKKCIG